MAGSFMIVLIIVIVFSLISWKIMGIVLDSDGFSYFSYLHIILAIIISPTLMYFGLKNVASELGYSLRRDREFYQRIILIMAIFGLPFIFIMEFWFVQDSLMYKKTIGNLSYATMHMGYKNMVNFFELHQTIITIMEIIGILMALYILIRFKADGDPKKRRRHLSKMLKTVFIIGIIFTVPLAAIEDGFITRNNKINEIELESNDFSDRDLCSIDIYHHDLEERSVHMAIFVPEYIELIEFIQPSETNMRRTDVISYKETVEYEGLEMADHFYTDEYKDSKWKSLSREVDIVRYDVFGSDIKDIESWGEYGEMELPVNTQFQFHYEKNSSHPFGDSPFYVFVILYGNDGMVDFSYLPDGSF